MRIQSNFKDFYDHLANYESDEHFVYKRYNKTVFIDIKSPLEHHLFSGSFTYNKYHALERSETKTILYFCGKFYLLETIDFYKNQKKLKTKYFINQIIINNEEMQCYFEQNNIVSAFVFKDETNYESFGKNYKTISQRYKIEIEPKLGVLLYCTNYKDNNVFTIQSIYQLVENFLSKQKDTFQIPKISNEIKLQQHGFDKKISFRHRK